MSSSTLHAYKKGHKTVFCVYELSVCMRVVVSNGEGAISVLSCILHVCVCGE